MKHKMSHPMQETVFETISFESLERKISRL